MMTSSKKLIHHHQQSLSSLRASCTASTTWDMKFPYFQTTERYTSHRRAGPLQPMQDKKGVRAPAVEGSDSHRGGVPNSKPHSPRAEQRGIQGTYLFGDTATCHTPLGSTPRLPHIHTNILCWSATGCLLGHLTPGPSHMLRQISCHEVSRDESKAHR